MIDVIRDLVSYKGANMSIVPEDKACSKCGEVLPLEMFAKRSDTKDGRRSQCRSCRNKINGTWQRTDTAKEYSRQWAKDNRDKVRKYEKRYWDKNPEKLKEKLVRNDKKYRERHPEKVRARIQEWQDNNPEKVKDKAKRYRDSHPNKSRDDARRRKALLLGVVSEKFTEQDIFDRWGTDCHICNEPVDLDAPRQVGAAGWEQGLHLEHVVPLKDGGPDTVENVKPSHGLCNLKKN
jgi:hypothetical protein